MKRLVLLRHAKSSWDFNVSDKDRPLTEKGVNRITMISVNSSNVLSGADLFFRVQPIALYTQHVL